MIEEIFPDLFRIEIPLPDSPLKSINSYVIKSDEKNLIIDTGLNRKVCLDAMLAGLKELDVDLDKTDFFITHSHADHSGLVPKLVRGSNSTYFNKPDFENLKLWKGLDYIVEYATAQGFPEDLLRKAFEGHPGFKYSPDKIPNLTLLEENDTLNCGDYSFKCIETPGHTRGHLCLYEANNKIMVSGDHILIDITPNIQCWSDEINPLKEYIDSLEKVYEMDVDLVLPGHRRCFKNFKERIDGLIEHHKQRADEIIVLLEKESKNSYQIASEMTWDIKVKSWDEFPPAQKWFATGEAISHVRYLEREGKIHRKIEKDIVMFSI
ncbi:MAG: MBL fold metallo-hydrolase [Desulfobacterales bacterium]|nr:MBL fold metallo-hydrolase [Desulfobacteraceae bacterium]MBT7698511.1 MBL fold metallo-hydrolase [Desulfobacterales bacterium]